ncbi:MAG TPA: ABC transporter permease [Acidisarcina sp.]
MKVLTHSIWIAGRQIRSLIRQPFYIAFTLVQPIVWLLLYGQLFKRVVELPGFNASSYITFLTPGVVVMTALFSGGWQGMGIISEMERGVLDRFLVSPVSRVALIAGRLLSMATITVIQSFILLTLGYIMGARFAGGLVGILVLLLSSILVSTPIAALSNALALAVRKEESVIGASNFLLLPLTFLSPVFMARNVMPPWIRSAARFNPVNWSVTAARAALAGHTDWGFVLLRLSLLVLFGVFAAGIATRAFRSYQNSV